MSDEELTNEKKERNTDKKRLDKIEADVKAIVDMLYSLKSAIGLPDHVLPKRD